MAGPLAGLRVIEMAGIGPGPFACMLVADMGAEGVRVDRTSGGMSMGENPADVMARGRKSIAVDLKNPAGVEVVLKLVESAQVIIEGFRPGVMEKLGLGPDTCLARNKSLVYGRMTGWGQQGPLAHSAGHDINYIAITGALASIGRAGEAPVPPLNLVGDFGGGSLYLIMGVLAALFESQRSGEGQVVDAAICDGAISLMACMQGFAAMGMWDGSRREANMLDGAAHYYDSYECSDGKFICIGSIEPQFYALLSETLGVDIGEPGFDTQFDKSQWPVRKQVVADAFRQKTQAQWCELMEGTDICFAPVLDMSEAPLHPHNVARQNFIEVEGVVQTAPAPRFSRTQGQAGRPAVAPGNDSREILQGLGLGAADVAQLLETGAVGQPS